MCAFFSHTKIWHFVEAFLFAVNSLAFGVVGKVLDRNFVVSWVSWVNFQRFLSVGFGQVGGWLTLPPTGGGCVLWGRGLQVAEFLQKKNSAWVGLGS